MTEETIRTLVVEKGLSPACLKTYRQCRGCYGWRNMLRAARSETAWLERPFKCLLTGLTLKTTKRSCMAGEQPFDGEKASSRVQAPHGYHKPETIGQAIGLMSQFKGAALVISGGTDILSRRQGRKKVSLGVHLIDISGLGLNYIRKINNSVCIGAATDINHLISSPLLSSSPYHALVEAAFAHSTHTIRNRATIGGNLCTASPCADLVSPLMALAASVIVSGPGGEKNIPLESFLRGANCTVLSPTELVREIVIPPQPEPSGASFLKLRRQQTAVDMAVVNVATRLSFHENSSLAVRIALGASGPVPFLAKRAAVLLSSQGLSTKTIQEASRMAAEESSPVEDIRASAAYRKQMVAVLVQNSLELSWERSRDE